MEIKTITIATVVAGLYAEAYDSPAFNIENTFRLKDYDLGNDMPFRIVYEHDTGERNATWTVIKVDTYNEKFNVELGKLSGNAYSIGHVIDLIDRMIDAC